MHIKENIKGSKRKGKKLKIKINLIFCFYLLSQANFIYFKIK